MPQQLTFELPVVTNRSRGDYFVSQSNGLAFKTVENRAAWPGRKLVLIGADGTGKTHLAHIWAEAAEAQIIAADSLNEFETAALSRLQAGANVVVDGADLVAGNAKAEAALFHLHNLVLAEGGSLLLTARKPPRDWGLALPDLLSRLNACAIATLESPDDALLSMVLIKLFSDRQISVSPALITYLSRRMDRSLAAAGELVSRLDKAALAEGRAISRSFAAEILDEDSENKA